jgi:PIN domain nuclease of toxin-antitoxin system
MVNKYILDACALAAFFNDEEGADVVQGILLEADDAKAQIYMNKLNLFEVYYGIRRDDGLQKAEAFYDMVKRLPITVINGISDEVFREAGRIKSSYKMSLADSIALGEASVMDVPIVTSDHHEFDVVEENETIRFKWIRDKK